jgi:hypothetical protein
MTHGIAETRGATAAAGAADGIRSASSGVYTLQWTGSGLGFVGSTAVFFTALPATATGNPLAIAAAVFSGMGALGSGAVLADCFAR